MIKEAEKSAQHPVVKDAFIKANPLRSSTILPENSIRRMVYYGVYRLLQSLFNDGIHTTTQKILHRIRNRKFIVREKYFEGEGREPDRVYEIWRSRNQLTAGSLEEMHKKSLEFPWKPVISVVIPTYKAETTFLERALSSIRDQCYPYWQICVCDDGSDHPESEAILKRHQAADPRIVCRFEKKNEGIVSASQKAVQLATGEFIAFMDQDDLLSPDAFYRVAEKLNQERDLDLIYSDNDKVDLNETHCEVYFKPDFSPDEFFCHNYIGHLSILRKSLYDEIGGFRPGYDGAQDFEILLRAIEKTERIAHLPYVLYSWRKTPGSTASSPGAKKYAYESGRKSLQNYFKRKETDVYVEETKEQGLYRCRFTVRDNPLISIIIASRGGSRAAHCARAVAEKSSYRNFEIVIVGDRKGNEAAKSTAGTGRMIRVDWDSGFQLYRMLNAGAERAQGSIMIFLSEQADVEQSDWIEALLEPIQRESVGVVGAKVLYPDRSIRQGGVVLGLGGFMDTAFKGVPDNAIIYNVPHRLVRNCSAVSAECMLMTSAYFKRMGGFDERFLNGCGDVDFCLRARKEGHWIVWTPFSVMRTVRSDSNGSGNRPEDRRFFEEKWKEVLSRPDPFYNTNLTRKYYDFSPDAD